MTDKQDGKFERFLDVMAMTVIGAVVAAIVLGVISFAQWVF